MTEVISMQGKMKEKIEAQELVIQEARAAN
jgi:hypothetical protein